MTKIKFGQNQNIIDELRNFSFISMCNYTKNLLILQQFKMLSFKCKKTQFYNNINKCKIKSKRTCTQDSNP